MYLYKRKIKSSLKLTFLFVIGLYSNYVFSASLNVDSRLRFDEQYLARGAVIKSQLDESTNYTLQDSSGLYGLYFRADYVDSLDSNFVDSRYALEMDFMEQGLAEYKKKMDKDALETRIQLLQIARDKVNATTESKIAELKKVRNLVYRITATYKHEKNELILKEHEAQLQEGALTQDVLIDTKRKYLQSLNNKNFYKQISTEKLSFEYFNISNKLEKFTLKSVSELFEAAKAVSLDLKILELMKQRTEFYPEYKDDVRLRAFVESRENTALFEDRETVVGLRVRVPLYFESSRADRVIYEKQQYERQYQIVSNRLMQKIESLRNQILFGIKTIQNKQIELEHLKQQIALAKTQSKANLDGLTWTPEATINTLELKVADIYKDALLARVDTLELVKRLAATINARGLNEVYNTKSFSVE